MEDETADPGPLVGHVLDAHADVGDQPGQVSDAAGQVAHHDRELDQPPVDGHASLDAPPEDRRVDVAAAQWHHNPAEILNKKRNLARGCALLLL